ncbi:unnamed protein product [Ilex paraguariensis]|uniref:RING-type domain-containing protein n=1 Tax=Ilex paraguariensis TaxID=185542 RepID=A0ABC8S1N5_9AQUA
MIEMVAKSGRDLPGLKERHPEAELTLNTRRHIISVHGSKELKQKVEAIMYEVAQTCGSVVQSVDVETACPICLCELEDGYRLEDCGHEFCRLCLVEQCESAIKSQGGFPMRAYYNQ